MADLPKPWLSPSFIAQLTEQLYELEFAYGLLISRIFVLIGSDLQECPFVGILAMIFLYNMIF